MRLAVISDSHANLPATEAVLRALRAEAPDAIWFLGDLVGRGPDPEVVPLLRESCDLVLAGNHDAVATASSRAHFPGALGRAIRQARATLSAEDFAWLSSLSPLARRHGITCVHGSLRDPYWEHISTVTHAKPFLLGDTRIILFGHTHEPVAFMRRADNGKVVRRYRQPGLELHLRDVAACMLNPGAVGCPQDSDGDPRASYLILDTDRQTARWERVQYPTGEIEQRIARLRLVPLRAR